MNNEKSSWRGFRDVLIEGVGLGSIIWDEKTGLIVGVYRAGESVPDGVSWLAGRKLEAYPAFIDGHVHDRFDEPGKEDAEHLEAACIEGGVGTIMTMPNNRAPFTHPDQLEARIKRWEHSKLTVRFHIGVARDNLPIIAKLGQLKNDWLGQVKEYDASSTNPSLLIDDEAAQYRAAEAIGESGRRKLVHAEYEPWLKRSRQMIEAERRLCLTDHCIIRSAEAEVEGIRRAIRICRETEVPTHFCHVSTKQGLDLIHEAKSRRLPVTAETCPHYWRLHAGHLVNLAGQAKMNPALRSVVEMEAIEEYVCQGLVDIIASDHAPHTAEEKSQEDYDKCPSGVPGVQSLGLSVYDLKARRKISAQQFVKLTSRNAARIFGLNKGELAAGKDADIVLIDPGRITTFTNSGMKSKCGWTPFHGQTVKAAIAAVVLRGKVVGEGCAVPNRG